MNQPEQPKSEWLDTESNVHYSSDIESLARAMENMSHQERCEAILKLANEQHNIGIKNGRFGYVHKSEAKVHEQAAVAEARIDELTTAYTQVVGDREVSLRSKFVKRFTAYLKARHATLRTSKPQEEIEQ
jgi:Fe2+ transport system protein B